MHSFVRVVVRFGPFAIVGCGLIVGDPQISMAPSAGGGPDAAVESGADDADAGLDSAALNESAAPTADAGAQEEETSVVDHWVEPPDPVGSLSLVSVASDGTQGNERCDAPSVTADGRF